MVQTKLEPRYTHACNEEKGYSYHLDQSRRRDLTWLEILRTVTLKVNTRLVILRQHYSTSTKRHERGRYLLFKPRLVSPNTFVCLDIEFIDIVWGIDIYNIVSKIESFESRAWGGHCWDSDSNEDDESRVQGERALPGRVAVLQVADVSWCPRPWIHSGETRLPIMIWPCENSTVYSQRNYVIAFVTFSKWLTHISCFRLSCAAHCDLECFESVDFILSTMCHVYDRT